MNPADHPMMLSLITVNAVVKTISVIGMIYMKNFFTEKTLDLMMYTIGIHTAMILQMTNFQLTRLANIV